jgi:glyoxylase-like metal-dependent hydrolase (beta-lactamase superfamily II)
MGYLPVNAFVIKGREPVLVDTGLRVESEDFMQALESVIDPQDLKWLWLTHDDSDHTGNLQIVLEAASNARLVISSLAALRMNADWQLPMERLYWLNPGESISAGDRQLTAVRPPLFDNPTTIGLYDNKSQAFFSADCFGALIPAAAQNADDVDGELLTQGMITWAGMDCPWVYMFKPGEFRKSLDSIHHLAPKTILSAHLPPAYGKTDQFLELLASVPASTPFVPPNQSVLEQILLQLKTSR